MRSSGPNHRLVGFGPLLVALLASGAAFARWLLQGSGNVYTDVGAAFYVPDPDLGWRHTGDGPLWIGLDVVVGLGLVAVGLGVLLLWRRRRGSPRIRGVAWAASLAALVVPIWAFSTGGGPEHRRDTLPVGELVVASSAGVSGSVPGLPPGRYRVLDHAASAVVARFDAGGERFEARFTGANGDWVGDPSDLRQPMKARVTVDAATVDTGITLRSKHAREELRLEMYPTVGFRLDGVSAARQESPSSIAFSARGVVELIGRTHDVEVTGVLSALASDGRARLGLASNLGPAFIVRASFSLRIDQTAIGNDGTFDTDDVPISVSLILVHETDEVPPS